ncbi:MAG: hypothetical protein PVG51_11030, partial [Desulfosarcina sp.]
SIGINIYLAHVLSARFQGIDQFIGGGAVKITIKHQTDMVFVFELDNSKVHGHRLPSFPPAAGDLIHGCNFFSAVDDRSATPGGW